jgi:hypothetical protein
VWLGAGDQSTENSFEETKVLQQQTLSTVQEANDGSEQEWDEVKMVDRL